MAAFRELRGSVDAARPLELDDGRNARRPAIWDVVRIPAELGRIAFATGDGEPLAGVVIASRVWRKRIRGATGCHRRGRCRRRPAGAHRRRDPRLVRGASTSAGTSTCGSPSTNATLRQAGTAGVGILGRLRDGRTAADAQEEASAAIGESAVVVNYSGTEPEIQLKLTELKRVLGWAAALVFLTAGRDRGRPAALPRDPALAGDRRPHHARRDSHAPGVDGRRRQRRDRRRRRRAGRGRGVLGRPRPCRRGSTSKTPRASSSRRTHGRLPSSPPATAR
jgi:hypothetical protein